VDSISFEYWLIGVASGANFASTFVSVASRRQCAPTKVGVVQQCLVLDTELACGMDMSTTLFRAQIRECPFEFHRRSGLDDFGPQAQAARAGRKQ
jgi:hypothetical protein